MCPKNHSWQESSASSTKTWAADVWIRHIRASVYQMASSSVTGQKSSIHLSIFNTLLFLNSGLCWISAITGWRQSDTGETCLSFLADLIALIDLQSVRFSWNQGCRSYKSNPKTLLLLATKTLSRKSPSSCKVMVETKQAHLPHWAVEMTHFFYCCFSGNNKCPEKISKGPESRFLLIFLAGVHRAATLTFMMARYALCMGTCQNRKPKKWLVGKCVLTWPMFNPFRLQGFIYSMLRFITARTTIGPAWFGIMLKEPLIWL